VVGRAREVRSDGQDDRGEGEERGSATTDDGACKMLWLLEWSYFEIHCVFLARILAQFRLSHHSTIRFYLEEL